MGVANRDGESARIRALETLVDTERLRARGEIARAAAEVEDLAAEVSRLSRRNRELAECERELASIRKSRTYRASRRVRNVVRKLRRRRGQGSPTSDAVMADYVRIIAGSPAEPNKPSYVFLVQSSRLDHPRDDLIAALGLARALSATGVGVAIAGESEWYAPRAAGTIAVSLLPRVDPRLVPDTATLVAWVRDRIPEWMSLPGLQLFNGIAAPSAIASREIARHYDGPLAVVRVGVDTDLFRPGRSPAPRSGDRTFELANRVEQLSSAAVTKVKIGPGSVGYGVLPARIFEAVACGSLPVVTSGVGLADAGLGEVPVARGPDGLSAVEDATKDGSPNQALARLQEEIRQHHTYSQRVADFTALCASASSTPERCVIDFHPDYSYGNPYQQLLYSEFTRSGGHTVAAADPVKHLVSRDAGGDLSGRIVHLHWLQPVVQPATSLRDAQNRLEQFKRHILDLKSRGAHIVWTVHNTLPHTLSYYFAEIELRQFVAEQADQIHVMSPATRDLTADYYRIPPEKVIQLPHPSYEGAYPVLLDRERARARMGFVDGECSFLFLGQLRGYKGVIRLLDAFEDFAGRDPDVRLDLVGRVYPELRDELELRLVGTDRVSTHFGHLPDDLMHLHLLAADVMVLPYERALNSGSIALATTFGLPVVVPRSPAFDDLEGRDFVETFEPSDTSSLVAALQRASQRLTTPAAREAARSYAAERNPAVISSRFLTHLLPKDSVPVLLTDTLSIERTTSRR